MITEKLKGLLLRYLDSLSERRDSLLSGFQALEQAVEQAGDGETDIRTLEAFALFRRDAHQLAGSGGSMGFPEIGRVAQFLDIALMALSDDARRPVVADVAQLKVLLDPLIRCLGQARLEDSSLMAPPDERLDDLVFAGGMAPGFSHPAIPAPVQLRLGTDVILVGSDEATRTHLAAGLAPFGLSLTVSRTLEDVSKAISGMTTLVLVDRDGMPDLPEVLQAGLPADIPVAVMDRDGSLRHRIEAQRAGGIAFLNKPVNAAVIVDLLERLHNVPDPRPPSIVLLGQDGMVQAVCAHAFRGASMDCVTVADPDSLLGVLADSRPDVLITCDQTGEFEAVEILASLRQHPAYASLPVILLDSSGEGSARSRAGVDATMSCPVDPDALVLSVHHRVCRARELQAMITRDALCNLLTHGAFITQLERELSLARRTRADLTVALLDIDGLRDINEQWGHQTGDAVLQGFSRLLRQRMRKTDILGRLGGETFAIILPGASKVQARQVIGDIAGAFRSMEQPCHAGVFTATFSAGLASFQDGDGSVRDCLRAADSALHAAKNLGRDQVCLSADHRATA